MELTNGGCDAATVDVVPSGISQDDDLVEHVRGVDVVVVAPDDDPAPLARPRGEDLTLDLGLKRFERGIDRRGRVRTRPPHGAVPNHPRRELRGVHRYAKNGTTRGEELIAPHRCSSVEDPIRLDVDGRIDGRAELAM